MHDACLRLHIPEPLFKHLSVGDKAIPQQGLLSGPCLNPLPRLFAVHAIRHPNPPW